MKMNVQTEIVTLPSGVEAEVREFIGADEDTLSNERLARQGKLADVLLRRITVKLQGEVPTPEQIGDLYSTDRAALLLAARKIAYGPELVGEVECSNEDCHETFEIELDLDALEVIEKPENLELSVTLPSGVVATIRPLKGTDEAKMIAARKQGDVMTALLLTRLVAVRDADGEDVSSADWKQWLSKGPVRDRKALREAMKSLDFGPQTVVDASCPMCGHTQQVEVTSLSGFFFPGE